VSAPFGRQLKHSNTVPQLSGVSDATYDAKAYLHYYSAFSFFSRTCYPWR